MTSVDLGCGLDKKPGAFGVDRAMLPGVDVVCDLDQSNYPFKNSCVDTVYSSHCIEHIEDVQKFMSNIWKMLRYGGLAQLTVPLASSPNSFQADHKHFFRARDFYYYEPGNKCRYYVEGVESFRVESVSYAHGIPKYLLPMWAIGEVIAFVLNMNSKRVRELYENFFLTYFPMKEFTVKLIKVDK